MKNTRPPESARKLLLFFLREDLAEEVTGDLEEKFLAKKQRQSLFRARLDYWLQVFSYLRPFAVRKSKPSHSNQFAMFQSYFKIGWRNLFKNKGYSVINIGGLSLGMAVTILIGLWIFDEVSFNTYHEHHGRIARVYRRGTINGETMVNSYLPYALGNELKTAHGSNFTHVAMAWPIGDHMLSSGDKIFSQRGEFFEAAGPEMFTLNMLKGSREGLKDPHSIFLSSSAAKTFFGDEDPMNKFLKIDNSMDVKVTGVYEDLPKNTHFSGVQFFAPWDLMVSVNPWINSQGFNTNFMDIYVELQPSVTLENADLHVTKAIINNIQENKEYLTYNPEIFLHAMDNWHLRSEWKNGRIAGGLIQFVWLFGIIGGFVLLLACINFMNLSTARSEKRAREVGIRKAIGSVRSQLVNQFFSESFLVVAMAFMIAILAVSLSMTWFNELAAKDLRMPWTNLNFWLICAAFIFFTGLIAGSYPAFYLSSFPTVKVLKGSLRAGRFATLPRKVLVVLQFTVSVTLVIGTVIVYQQIQFAKNRPVGYSRDGLLMILMSTAEFYGKLEVFRTELKNTGVVKEVAESSSPVTGIWSSDGGFEWPGKDPDLQTDFGTLSVSHDYGKTVGWEFTHGRDFSRELSSDSAGIVITETALKFMNLDEPVGESVKYRGKEYKIVGVIRDMIMESPFGVQMPTAFFLNRNSGWLNIRIDPSVSTADALLKIEAVFKKIVPASSFDFKFADQEYETKFAAEERIGKLASVFAVLAISISCLGLFGLASFVAEQRTKEIGIRKVVGASVFSLWKMLSGDFVILVVVSCVLSVPVAYYFLLNWLKDYNYHIDMSSWVFIFSSLGAVMITLVTVSYQAIKAALMNPVKSLRSE